MLESFFKTHDYLVEHLDVPVRRQLMDEINWDDRLIAIKGSRGAGKTTFLLSYAKEFWAGNHECLYVNCNNFYFARHSLLEFAGMFVAHGGKCLLLDQTFKYENWSKELRECYELYTDLQIVFSASPVMRLLDENEHLHDIVKMYNLRGFSFREYLNLKTGKQFRIYSIQEILHDHERIAEEIVAEVNPMNYFRDYLYQGYYPFCVENHSYEESLLKTMNMMLEVDILLIKQIDIAYLPKIRRILFQMLANTPCTLNVSKLAEIADTSRATVMNYIKYLKDARLLNLLYMEDKQFPLKPARVYMQNPNLLFTLPMHEASEQHIAETFFYNALHATHKIYATDRDAMFAVDPNKVPSLQTQQSEQAESYQVTPTKRKLYFNVSDVPVKIKHKMRPTAVGNMTIGRDFLIPLWLFGFLY